MSVEVSIATDEAAVRACWPLFAQLRPHLADEEEFISRWFLQVKEGYRILRAVKGGMPVGAAGFRILHTMAWGRILYLDDLIVDEGARGTGLGSRLLAVLKEIARDEKCDQVHLDTGYQRHAAHKAYLRAGFHLDCHHLALPLGSRSS
jgi:GNAT superfamily N-acetyltransferase